MLSLRGTTAKVTRAHWGVLEHVEIAGLNNYRQHRDGVFVGESRYESVR